MVGRNIVKKMKVLTDKYDVKKVKLVGINFLISESCIIQCVAESSNIDVVVSQPLV